MSDCLLSICIPTYNGGRSSLDLVLEAAVKIAGNYDDIEVIVSDNCSTDNTQELVCCYSERCPSLKYYRNKENLGFNGNMLNLSKYANGEYAWMIGDDDVINLGTFGVIYDLLKKRVIDYLSVRFRMAYREEYKVGDFVDDNVSINYSSFADVLQNNCFRGNTLATFMGSSIFRVSLFKSVDTSMIENKFDNYYNCFPNAYIISTAFCNAKCAYITKPCIVCVSSKMHHKGYENINSWATIDTKAIVELYEYVCSLGISRESLKRTEDRIIFDYIVTGAKMRRNGLGYPDKYLLYILKAMSRPKLISTLLKKCVNSIFKTNLSISI